MLRLKDGWRYEFCDNETGRSSLVSAFNAYMYSDWHRARYTCSVTLDDVSQLSGSKGKLTHSLELRKRRRR
jgi:hypothetical protein